MQRLLWGTIAAAACSAVAFSAMPLLAQDDDLFGKLDANKDGFVTADEVEGDGKAKIERLLRTSDKDGDKKLSKDEFAAGLKEPDQPRQPLGQGAPGRGDRGRPGGNPPNAEAIAAMFDRTDANSDGKITKEEVPEDRREGFGRMLERMGAESMNKEQFARYVTFSAMQGRPGAGRPGEGRPPLVAALDADNDGELSAGEIEAAGKALLKLDKNSDGKLTRDELGPPGGPGRPGEGRPPEGRGRPNAEQFLARLKEADKDGDGKLSKDEVEKGEVPQFLKEGFGRIDANSDGFLDQEEMRRVGQRQGGRGDRPRAPEGERRPEGDRRPDAPRRE